MTTKTQQAVTAAIDSACHIDDFNRAAVDAFITAAQERTARKVVQKRRGAKERGDFFGVLPKAVDRANTVRQGVVLAVEVASQGTEDSLAWYIQGIAQELYWTFRSVSSRARRADQQVRALEQADDSSVAELAAELASDLGLNTVSDEDTPEKQSYTVEDVESFVNAIHQGLSDIYIHLSDTGMATVPFLTRGSQVATSLDAAGPLADAIIDEANQQQKQTDKAVLRDLASR